MSRRAGVQEVRAAVSRATVRTATQILQQLERDIEHADRRRLQTIEYQP